MDRRDRGFALVEALVSLFVISVALAGSFAVIMHNVNTGNFIKNNFIASGLAQEGIEVVRNLRDTDWFAGRPFGSFGGAGAANGTYCVQWNSTELLSPCNTLLTKDANGFFGHDTGTNTIFSRTVAITPISAAEIKVVVEVAWQERFGTRRITAEEHVFNWF